MVNTMNFEHPLSGRQFLVESSKERVSCASMGKSRNVPAGVASPWNVIRYVNHVPQGSSLWVAATHNAGVSPEFTELTVTARLKRWLMLSNCTRGSVRLSEVRSRRLRVTGPPHCTAPTRSVTWMRSLTTWTILPAPAAALGSGGGLVQLEQVSWTTPSKGQGT